MGLGNRFKKLFEANQKEKSSSDLDFIKEKSRDGFDGGISRDSSNTHKKRNFRYLDEMIHGGSKEIVLDSDIILDDFNELEYVNGIRLDVDDIVIDGNGHSIDAQKTARMFNVSARNVTIKNLTFKNGLQIDASALINKEHGSLTMENCMFKDNMSQKHGGAISNFGKLHFIDSNFINNRTTEGAGGVINNQPDGEITLENCNFKDNVAQIAGGAITNFGKIHIDDTDFINNVVKEEDGGAIDNQRTGEIDISNCNFNENSTREYGGAIINIGKIRINDTDFVDNVANASGGAINNQADGEITLNECNFNHNNAYKNGGAVLNWGKITIKSTKFTKNASKDSGGAIENLLGSACNCISCEFKNNESANFGIIFNESDGAKFVDCTFSQHNSNSSMIFNKNDLTFIDCTFKDNNLKYIIFNDVNSILDLSGGEIADNVLLESAIYNRSDNFMVNNTTFDNNDSKSSPYSGDILNEGNLTLQSPKFKTSTFSVLNKKHIVVKKLPHMEVEKTIRNSGTGTIDEPMPVESKYDFSHLNQIMREDNDGVIALEYDIVLKDYELDFFEGGIEIDKSNITIEGNDHVIDACGKTRIFNVVGKDITIRNVIFKNGFVSNKYGEHVTGGGAIKTVKDSSLTLENCQFIDNSSDNDGGAIQNNGTLHSKNNQYLNNNSKYNGGSICNNNLLYTTNDTFNDNNARIAGAIYNNERLNVRDISLSNNDSDFKQPIYNADTITIKNTPSNGGNILLSYIGAGINTEEMIYNTCEVNEMETDGWESFNLLKDKLEKSREISLEKNVKIEYGDIGTDEISIHNDIVFNGNGHVIDFNHLNLNFKIRNDVVFKNVVFKNAYVHKDALFEIESKTKFVNVQFINNRAAADNCLIKNNNGEVVFTDSSFCNNSTKNNSLISNNGELAIVNTDFINNDGQSSGTVINNIKDNNDKVSIENSGFINNFSAREGATIYSQSFTVFEIRDSKFINNCSNVYGGAIYNFGEFKLSNCIFKGNSSSQGGALYSMHGSVFDIDGCVFKENDAREGGGAIVNFGKISIKGTDFIKNTTLKEGGAINNQSTGMVIRNCNFNENEAQEFGGAIATADVDVRKLIDCTFKGNNPSDVN